MTPTEQPPSTNQQPPAGEQPAAAPFDPTVRVESQRRSAFAPADPELPSRGRSLGPVLLGLLLLSVTLISAGIGFVLSGGQLPGSEAAATPAATAVAQAAPPPPVQATSVPQPPAATMAPQPTGPPPATTAPIAAVQPEPARSTAAPKPAAAQQTSAQQTAPQPTAVQPTAAQPTAPQPAAPQPTSPPATKPAAQPAGRDPRFAQVERTVQEYFAALNAQDYARAHQVCCTDAWRARYPLDRWERNFDGVTDLQLVGEPRYQRVEPDVIVVDTDYTFRSGGRQRDFTLRWTFRPVDGRWQAELAEAFAR